MRIGRFIGALGLGTSATPLLAQMTVDPAVADLANSGDTAFVLGATFLIVLMALPGLFLWQGGMARPKNLLSVGVALLGILALTSLLWVVVGYTLAFGPSGGGFLGGGLNWMLLNLGNIRDGTTIPESAFAMFQMVSAVLAAALVAGAVIERARFGWLLAFAALWSLMVYAPVAHWLWGNGWLATRIGALDFAGGIVIQLSAGVSGLVAALMVGKRIGFADGEGAEKPRALTLAGAALLWLGWLALAGGNALTATDDAAAAIINTHLGASVGVLVWLLLDRLLRGASTATGAAQGAIAGFVAISAGAGFIGPGAAIVIAASGALIGYFAVNLVRNGFGVDDSCQLFAIHGVGGAVGALLLALFIAPGFGGIGYGDGMGFGSQFVAQLVAVGAVTIWSAVITAIIGFGLSFILPMRVSEKSEREGLDLANHGESAWDWD
ncbi:MAG: ammonium transporter [Parasphingorhabdus sp.]|nr:ammonium transporter [Parasphingorhabdus sp.]